MKACESSQILLRTASRREPPRRLDPSWAIPNWTTKLFPSASSFYAHIRDEAHPCCRWSAFGKWAVRRPWETPGKLCLTSSSINWIGSKSWLKQPSMLHSISWVSCYFRAVFCRRRVKNSTPSFWPSGAQVKPKSLAWQKPEYLGHFGRIREILSRYVTIMQLVRNMGKCRRVEGWVKKRADLGLGLWSPRCGSIQRMERFQHQLSRPTWPWQHESLLIWHMCGCWNSMATWSLGNSPGSSLYNTTACPKYLNNVKHKQIVAGFFAKSKFDWDFNRFHGETCLTCQSCQQFRLEVPNIFAIGDLVQNRRS